jgi:hypothetical protein
VVRGGFFYTHPEITRFERPRVILTQKTVKRAWLLILMSDTGTAGI